MMDYPQSLLDSIASFGWGVAFPLAAMLMFAAPVMNSYDLGRVVNNALTALAYIPIFWVVWKFIADKQSRYRWWHFVLLFYFAVRFSIHIWILIDVYKGFAHIPAPINYISTLSECALAYTFWVTRDELTATYRYDPRAEEARKENVQSLHNSAQIAINVEHLVNQRLERSQDFIANAGRS